MLRRVSNLLVKIFCAYFGHTYLHFFWLLFIFCHVRCLNILNFDHWFHFWSQIFFEAFWLLSFFGAIILPCFTGHFISRASARRSACVLCCTQCKLSCTKFFKNLQFMSFTGPGKVWTRETIFVKKKKKMLGILWQWPLSLHHKAVKFLNMALILPILKILQN